MKQDSNLLPAVLLAALSVLLSATMPAQAAEVACGKWTVRYDDAAHNVTLLKNGTPVLSEVSSRFKFGGTVYQTSSYGSGGTLADEPLTDAVGSGRRLTITYNGPSASLPVVEQNYYLYADADYVLTDVVLRMPGGQRLESNYIAPVIPRAPFSARWTTELCPTVTGNYIINLRTDDGCRMWIDGKQVLDAWVSHPATDNVAEVTLEAGRRYHVVIEYFDGGGDAYARLLWKAPDVSQTSRIEYFGDAGKAARECDAVVAVLGIDKSIEREGQDRYTLDLPADQREFIQELYRINPRTVVVLVAGSSLALNWIDAHVPAVLDAWYPGEQGGTAVAEALFGDYNPGGRLPLTFYRSTDDLPAFDDYSLTGASGRTYQYFTGKPLYEFGYGLSYTTFRYSQLATRDLGESVEVTFTVANTGKRDGDEVAQVYVHYPATGTYMPIKQLRGFERVHIARGKKQAVRVVIPKKELRYWDENKRAFVTPKGQYTIMVGSSSERIHLQSDINL